MKYAFLLWIVAALFSPENINGQMRLPAVLSSGMVLQQKDSCALWGWAHPGEKVFVTTGWNNVTDSTIATSGARWSLKMATPAAGGPYQIHIVHHDTVVLQDVMIGEVWLCSGQSNMEWSYYHGEKDIAKELPSTPNPNIRFFHVPKTTSAYPQDDVKARWTVCDSNTIKSFSAVGYFFGKKINDSLNVPIGLINASWGGTSAETWTPGGLIDQDTSLARAAAQLTPQDYWPVQPAIAFNGMISPLAAFNIAGSIFYQGETNVGTNSTYTKLFTTMIDGWRSAWKKEFPFYYVQIAPYDYGDNVNGALLQEAQTKSMRHPNVGMAVITDLVDSVTDIHPSHKKEVGNRLAAWALGQTYKKKDIHYKSPLFTGVEKRSNRLVLSFDNVPTRLISKDKKVSGFFISDDKSAWHPAEARLDNNKIILWNKKVKVPVHVRYGFSNTVPGNVFSAEGLPLVPFRTDNFEK